MTNEIRVDTVGIRSQVVSSESSINNVSPYTPTVEYTKIMQIENLIALHERLNGITEILKCVIGYDLERILGFVGNIETLDEEFSTIFDER